MNDLTLGKSESLLTSKSTVKCKIKLNVHDYFNYTRLN